MRWIPSVTQQGRQCESVSPTSGDVAYALSRMEHEMPIMGVRPITQGELARVEHAAASDCSDSRNPDCRR